MKRFTYQIVTTVAALCLFTAVSKSQAQVSFGVQIGAEPACPYGYYDYAPYQCAPYGYYGPEWFSNGVFIGSGPWYHGHDRDFRGHIDRHYDPHYGYRGGYPSHGERGDWDHHHGTVENFHGRDMRSEHFRGNQGYQGGRDGGYQGRDGGGYQGGHNDGGHNGGGHDDGGRDGHH